MTITLCIIFFLLLNINVFTQSIVFNNVYVDGDSLLNGADFIVELNEGNKYLMQMQSFT